MRLTGVLAEKGLHAFDNEQRVHAGHVALRLWILVVDKEKAQLYRKAGHGLQKIGVAEFKTHHHQDGRGEHMAEKEFVSELSTWLSSAQDEQVFDRVILVASPRLLGYFREALPQTTQACITAEIPKDLTHLSHRELETALEKIAVL